MQVAPQPIFSARRRPSRKQPVSSQPTGKAKPRQLRSSVPLRNPSQRVERIPSARIAPLWLRTLFFLHHSSRPLSLFLVGATLVLYAWTVYSQQLWGREYRKLESLQRNERHLTAANEALKDQLAIEAERPGNGLVPPNPANTLFLPPAPQRPPVPTPPATSDPKTAPPMPLGY